MSPPTRFFVEGADFLRRADLTELSVSLVEDRVSLRVAAPYDIRMTPAEAYTLGHVLITASRALGGT